MLVFSENDVEQEFGLYLGIFILLLKDVLKMLHNTKQARSVSFRYLKDAIVPISHTMC